MAMNDNITLKVSLLKSEETFSGELCTACGDCIYGAGFRVVVTTSTSKNVLPNFNESKIILCQSCNDAVEW